MPIEDIIRAKLVTAFEPAELEVINESHLHCGHQGSPGTGESHFRVKMVAEAFIGRSRLERHRMVNEVLADELAGPVHALAVSARAPGELERR